MNQETVDELKRFAKQLDASAAACGKECDSRADLIRGMLADYARLKSALSTLESSNKIERKMYEDHFINGDVFKRMSNGQFETSREDTNPDNASIGP